MTNHPVLSKTPIKEIIFTISYAETIDLETLRIFSQKAEISHRYTSIRDGFTTQLVTSEGQKPQASIKNDGYILKCNSENKVIQAREGSFSFHKMNEHEDFLVLLNELLGLWYLLLECNKNTLSVNNISLRYLNFIEQTSNEKISELVTVRPSNPFSDDLESCFLQLNFSDEKYEGVKIALVVATTVNKDATSGLILDIILNQPQNSLLDYKLMTTHFEKMREIKNDIFFKSITKYTQSKYQ